MKNLHQEVRNYYLLAIANLIVCEDLKLVEKILKALFTISQSETDGPTVNGRNSACLTQEGAISKIIDPKALDWLQYNEASLETSDCNDNKSILQNEWYE